jgi:hypothetical protein
MTLFELREAWLFHREQQYRLSPLKAATVASSSYPGLHGRSILRILRVC